eukprot:7116883-Pyramimonas_sp.AAC.1
MFASAAHVREFVKHEVADALELEQYWALQALRGWRLGKDWLIHRALKCYPTLQSHFCLTTFQCIRLEGLCSLIRSVQMQLIDEESRELELANLSPEVKASKKNRVNRMQELWRRFKSRTGLTGIYDESGAPCRSVDHSAEVLRPH